MTLTSWQLIKALADLFDEVGPETPEEVDAALIEYGYDPDKVGKLGKQIAEEALAKQAKRLGIEEVG